MSGEKYIGMDVHQATISVAVMDSQGKVIMESNVRVCSPKTGVNECMGILRQGGGSVDHGPLRNRALRRIYKLLQ